MLANDTIGTGPRLQFLTEDDSLNDRIEHDFLRWSAAVSLPEKLRLMRIARCQDGESFAMFQTNPKNRNEVKLDLVVIEADRIADYSGGVIDPYNIDGVLLDKFGNPTAYKVVLENGWTSVVPTYAEAATIPAQRMIHIYRMDRPGLHRGVPELTAALPLFRMLRQYNLAVLSAAQAAADFAAVLYTDTMADDLGSAYDDSGVAVSPMDRINLQRNTMMTLPAGWKMDQLDPKHPSDNHSDFIKGVLGEIARCVCGTYGIVSGDFSGYNYASGRLDSQVYHKAITVDRSLWEHVALDRIFHEWLREYRLIHPEVNIEEYPDFEWFWDGFPHVDPMKEANAEQVRLGDKTTTYAEVFAKQGKDWRSEFRQMAKEQAEAKRLGLVLNPEKATGASNVPEEEIEE